VIGEKVLHHSDHVGHKSTDNGNHAGAQEDQSQKVTKTEKRLDFNVCFVHLGFLYKCSLISPGKQYGCQLSGEETFKLSPVTKSQLSISSQVDRGALVLEYSIPG